MLRKHTFTYEGGEGSQRRGVISLSLLKVHQSKTQRNASKILAELSGERWLLRLLTFMVNGNGPRLELTEASRVGANVSTNVEMGVDAKSCASRTSM